MTTTRTTATAICWKVIILCLTFWLLCHVIVFLPQFTHAATPNKTTQNKKSVLLNSKNAAEAPKTYRIGDMVYAHWYDEWYLARIISEQNQRYQVHYIGYPTYWDEWVNSKELEALPPDESNLAAQQPTSNDNLFSAVRLGKLDFIKQHVTNNITANTTDADNFSLLQMAARHDQSAIVQYLLHLGADINHTNRYNETALSIAGAQLHWTIALDLLNAGADPNTGTPVLGYAVQNGQLAVVQRLLSLGAKTQIQLPMGLTPLQLAKQFDQTKIADLLQHAESQHS